MTGVGSCRRQGLGKERLHSWPEIRTCLEIGARDIAGVAEHLPDANDEIPSLIWIEAGAIRDARGEAARPGHVVVWLDQMLCAGSPEVVAHSVNESFPAGYRVRRIDLSDHLVLPAFVNAHAHLDLTDLGPTVYDGSFQSWVGTVVRGRPTTPGTIRAAVQRGLRMSHEAGVGWIGDIAGSDDAARARCEAPGELQVPGVSWLECFGIGESTQQAADRALAWLDRARDDYGHAAGPDLTLDLQPHAPYSAGLELYHAVNRAAPCTHLAETLDEDRFVRHGDGPFADLLRRIDKWDDSLAGGTGQSPIAHLAPALRRGRWVVAHVNYASDDDLDLLAACPDLSVAYCPIASDYFGHRGHRYREMLERGIRVALGTDSILCQPAHESQPLGILPQARHLYRRDGTDPKTLLRMATVHGAQALGLPEGCATFECTTPARLCAVPFDAKDPRDAWEQVLDSSAPARRIP